MPLKKGVNWSDGHELDANDFVFTVSTVLDMQLDSNWASAVDPAFLDRVEALDSHRLKVYFKTVDADGSPQTPGLSVWQFGLGFMPVLAEHYWTPPTTAMPKAPSLLSTRSAQTSYPRSSAYTAIRTRLSWL